MLYLQGMTLEKNDDDVDDVDSKDDLDVIGSIFLVIIDVGILIEVWSHDISECLLSSLLKLKEKNF